MTLRTKLNLLFGCIMLGGLVLMTLSALELMRREMEATMRQNLSEAIQEIGHSLERTYGRLTPNPEVVRVVVEATVQDFRHVSGVRMEYRVAGAPVMNHELWFLPADQESLNRPPQATREQMMGVPAVYALGPGAFLMLTVYADMGSARAFQRRLAGSLGLAALLTVAACVFLADRVTHHLVTSPLEGMRRLTQKVAEGDLTAAVPSSLQDRRDEMGTLSSSFSRMMDALRRTRSENEALLANVRTFNRQLETRVAEATAQLGRKNLQLSGANAALIEARDQLTRQERLAALGQLSGSIAHEIGTPLSTISGHLQLLLCDPNLPPDVREAIAVAQDESVRVRDIIRRFLARARGAPPAREIVSMPDLLAQVVDLSLPAGQRSRYEVETRVAPDVVDPRTDPALLRQLLINVVANARDAMPSGGRLWLSATREDQHLIICVDDSGPGIPPEMREHVFEPFFTTKKAGEGTGLGLAICKEITRALHGTLSVSGAPIGGARFSVKVPAWDEEDLERERSAA